MTHLKKIYVLKREREDTMFSSPKTPVKRIPYRDVMIYSAPFSVDAQDSLSFVDRDGVSSDVFVTVDRNLVSDSEKNKRVFVCKTGEGAFYEVFICKEGECKNFAFGSDEEPEMLCKNKKLCIHDVDYTAVKRSKKRISGEFDRKNRIREVEMLRKICSEHVVKCCDFWEDCGHFFMELEYCSIGTLRDYINEVYFLRKSRFSQEMTKKMMYELADGLSAIHDCNIVHFDLKPENILMKNTCPQKVCVDGCKCSFPIDLDSFSFKISDFNISRYEGEKFDDDGDKRYMAPEVLRNICTKASDVYSLGLIYLEVVAGIILPKSGDSWVRLRRNNFGGIKLDRVCKLMLNMNYRKRLNAKMVREVFSKGIEITYSSQNKAMV